MRWIAAVAAFLVITCSSAAPHGDTYTQRVELLAMLQTLNADILASPSATATLERWCGEHAMAAEPRIVVDRVTDVQKAATAEQLQRLGVSDSSDVKYRRVRLRCGTHVFSEADNWYVPSRLTPEMNRMLDTSDVPFGKVVRDLAPYRRTIAVSMLWSPLPSGWEMRPRRATGPFEIPQRVMVHTAILYTSTHQPFAEVVETYQRDLFDFTRK